MVSAFRMLVYAVAAVAVIALAYQIMGPLLFPMPDNLALISRSLEASETGLGKAFTSQTFFQAGEGLSAQTFNSRLRNVSFQCINPTLCCPQTKECQLPIEWDNNSIRFNSSRTVPVTTRCRLVDIMYACEIYWGEEPAQVEIVSVSAPEEVDLGRESMYFDIVFSNSGNKKIEEAEAEVKVFQRYFEAEKWEEKPVEHASKTESLGSILPGETREKKVSISLNQNGPFRALVTVRGLSAGYDEESVLFSTSGATSDCSARNCESPVFVEGKCTARCYCQKCLLGSTCAEVLKQADNVDLGLSPGITISNGVPEALASNIVDMVLEDRMCPSDITVIEPNAVGSLVGFEVKNIGKNPVQSAFSVRAMLGQGLIGSVDVSPGEINETGSVIKIIDVEGLQLGSHEIRLAANQERAENEENYGNNEADVPVEITVPPEKSLVPEEVGLCCGFPMGVVEQTVEDGTGTLVQLRTALEQGKARADFEANGLKIKFRLQNMSNEKLRVLIPQGQVFVPEESSLEQNLAAGKDLVIELPVCTIYVNEFKAYCINRLKEVPYGKMDVGIVLEEEQVLEALSSGFQNYVWNVISKLPGGASDYGSGSTVSSKPTDPLAGVDLTPQECEAAGLRPLGLDCTEITDPDDVSDFYCIIQ